MACLVVVDDDKRRPVEVFLDAGTIVRTMYDTLVGRRTRVIRTQKEQRKKRRKITAIINNTIHHFRTNIFLEYIEIVLVLGR